MIETVNNWMNIIQYSLLPANCIFCNKHAESFLDLCNICQKGLLPLNIQCSHCAQPLEIHSSKKQICGRCQNKPPAFDKVYAPYIHQGEIRYLINQLKFEKAYKNSRLLGLLLSQFLLTTQAVRPDIIVPVPLHIERYRQRGYNQTLEITKVISKDLAIPIEYKNCLRTQNTPHQISLNLKQRQHNIKGAFTIKQPLTVQHVAILDDVMTTGATVNELAKTLKAAGAKRVDIWVCARA
jgi:ComF family protein